MIYFLIQAQIPLVLEYSKVSVCINISLIQYRVSIEPDDDDEGSIIPRPARWSQSPMSLECGMFYFSVCFNLMLYM